MSPHHQWIEKIPLLLAVFVVSGFFWGVLGLDCFKCVSIGGNNPSCDEPFNNNYSVDILESPCMGGRKNRYGVFPSTACLKLSGVYEDTKETMVVRGCGLDSGTLTVDTEIVRMSHCGGFEFEKRYVRGCVQSCFEDACNDACPAHLVPAPSSVGAVALVLGYTALALVSKWAF